MSSQASSSELSQLSEQFQDTLSDIHPAALTWDPYDIYSSSPPPQITGFSSLTQVSSPPPTSIDPTRRPRTCWVYKHMPDLDIETKYYSTTNSQLEWRYKYCPKRYALNGGTRCMKSHLKTIHNISEDSPREERAKKRQLSIEDALATGSANPQKRRCLEILDPTNLYINPDQLEVLYIKFLVSCNLSLRLVESPAFRDLLTFLNKDIDIWLPDSHNTILTWLLRQFSIQKVEATQRLYSARTLIHLSLDLWTSLNGLAILGIISHYISEEGILEESVLSMKVVEGQHTGENLTTYVLETITDYGFASKLGYLQMDNALNNDTLIRVLSNGQ
jgi:hypothetical protein